MCFLNMCENIKKFIFETDEGVFDCHVTLSFIHWIALQYCIPFSILSLGTNSLIVLFH